MADAVLNWFRSTLTKPHSSRMAAVVSETAESLPFAPRSVTNIW